MSAVLPAAVYAVGEDDAATAEAGEPTEIGEPAEAGEDSLDDPEDDPKAVQEVLQLTPEERFGTEQKPLVINKTEFRDVSGATFFFLDTSTVAHEWTFPYSDEFFETPPEEFNQVFAQGSFGFAVSTFRSTKGIIDPTYETYLRAAGFTDIYLFGYDEPTRIDSLSGVIARKEVNGYTVIAMAACGQGYGKEWGGNLTVGPGDVHQGFRQAADILEGQLEEYYKKYPVEGPKKMWITGFSRAGAVGNLTAADMIDSGEYEAVYAYLFGVPRTTKHPAAYPGIYNIMGQFDPVPNTPLATWGFARNGTDVYTPAQESDSGYLPLAKAAAETGDLLYVGERFRNNPEINYQLHLTLEFMSWFFPTNADYAERFQDILVKNWKEPEVDHVPEILLISVKQMDDLSKWEEEATDVLLNYVTYVVGQHMRANQRQIDDGSWRTFESLGENLVLEHRPTTYLKWLFTDADPESLFTSNTSYRRVFLKGDFSLAVYSGGKLIQTMDREGQIEVPEDATSKLFSMRNAETVMVVLPDDEAYRLIIHTDEDGQELTYYDVFGDVSHLKSTGGTMFVCEVDAGDYEIAIEPSLGMKRPEVISGRLDTKSGVVFHASPFNMMREELVGAAPEYLTLDMLIRIVVIVLGFVVLLNIINDFVGIRWRVRWWRGYYGRASAYFSVNIRALNILVFAVLTQFLTFYAYSFVIARTISATVMMFFIFTMAFRGFLRFRNRWNFLTAMVLLALVPLTYRYYYDVPFLNEFSAGNVLLFILVVAVLTAFAARVWFRRGRPVIDDDSEDYDDDDDDGGENQDGIGDTRLEPDGLGPGL